MAEWHAAISAAEYHPDSAEPRGKGVVKLLADLTGREALVTGAGGGMGRAIVAALAEQGAAVAIADVDTDLAADVAGDHEALVVELDVTSSASVEQAFGRVASAWGPLDILVNNAGVGVAPDPLAGEEPEIDWDQTWDVNVKGVVRCCAAVIEPMRERRYGRIVNIASIAGHAECLLQPQLGWSWYSTLPSDGERVGRLTAVARSSSASVASVTRRNSGASGVGGGRSKFHCKMEVTPWQA